MITIGRKFPSEDLFVCPVCGKEYKTESGLNAHMAKEHGETNAQNEE